VGREVAGLAPGQKHPVDLAVEPLRCDRGAGEGGDRLGGCVGLLSGEATVFYWEVGGVAGGVDAFHAAHFGVAVDCDESVLARG
jgi:hypothetical protein